MAAVSILDMLMTLKKYNNLSIGCKQYHIGILHIYTWI